MTVACWLMEYPHADKSLVNYKDWKNKFQVTKGLTAPCRLQPKSAERQFSQFGVSDLLSSFRVPFFDSGHTCKFDGQIPQGYHSLFEGLFRGSFHYTIEGDNEN